jgi:hypothetical protein
MAGIRQLRPNQMRRWRAAADPCAGYLPPATAGSLDRARSGRNYSEWIKARSELRRRRGALAEAEMAQTACTQGYSRDGLEPRRQPTPGRSLPEEDERRAIRACPIQMDKAAKRNSNSGKCAWGVKFLALAS